MCVIAAKYFKESGWILIKNRDRNYKPIIKVIQSKRRGMERLLLWDTKTKWTEGVNEYGIAVVSSAVQVKKDEKEGVTPEQDTEFYSPDGKKVRTALYENTIEKCVAAVIKLEIAGNTLISDGERLFVVEGDFKEENKKGFVYEKKEVKKTEIIVRTNHGIMIDSGYNKDEPDEKVSWSSSVKRKAQCEKDIKSVETPLEMLDSVSDTSNKNGQMNPLRISKTHGKKILVTTGQLMIVPKERTMHYRPIWGSVKLENFDKLNNQKTKTWFEIISSRKLMSFKESINILKKR